MAGFVVKCGAREPAVRLRILFFFFFNYYFIFIFGCVGSSLLHGGFL